MRAEASREIPASRDQLWGFLAEPYHLSDWWPGIAAVRPDRRGLMPGARWELAGPSQPTLFHSANARAMLVVGRVEPYERVTWTLLDQRLEVEVRLTTMAPDRTRVTVAIEGPWRPEVLGRPRSLPSKAVARLHALVQTAASL